jgi:hypothetical protein
MLRFKPLFAQKFVLFTRVLFGICVYQIDSLLTSAF